MSKKEPSKKIYSTRVAIANLQDLLDDGYKTLNEQELLIALGVRKEGEGEEKPA